MCLHRSLEGGPDSAVGEDHLQTQACGPQKPGHSAVHENDAAQRHAGTGGQLLCMRIEQRHNDEVCEGAGLMHPVGRGQPALGARKHGESSTNRACFPCFLVCIMN
jgi:hypothetical protein